MVAEEQIVAILEEEKNARSACERLVSEANKQGGKDNITAIVAHFGQQNTNGESNHGEA
jgi:serine/threonine protein phosphatase PrpC